MTIIRKLNDFFKKTVSKPQFPSIQKLGSLNHNYLILFSILIFFSLIFFISGNLIEKKNLSNTKNFKNTTKSTEFLNLSNFFISKINSPYEEEKYLIENNDSIEKILKKFKIKNDDIKNITLKLKQKTLKCYIQSRSFLQRGSNLISSE